MTKVYAFKTCVLAGWVLLSPVLLTKTEDRPYLTTETPITLAHHIAVFDVSGFVLKRSPFVLHTGHGPPSLVIGPRFLQ